MKICAKDAKLTKNAISPPKIKIGYNSVAEKWFLAD